MNGERRFHLVFERFNAKEPTWRRFVWPGLLSMLLGIVVIAVSNVGLG
jgi:hypothetical protein